MKRFNIDENINMLAVHFRGAIDPSDKHNATSRSITRDVM